MGSRHVPCPSPEVPGEADLCGARLGACSHSSSALSRIDSPTASSLVDARKLGNAYFLRPAFLPPPGIVAFATFASQRWPTLRFVLSRAGGWWASASRSMRRTRLVAGASAAAGVLITAARRKSRPPRIACRVRSCRVSFLSRELVNGLELNVRQLLTFGSY